MELEEIISRIEQIGGKLPDYWFCSFNVDINKNPKGEIKRAHRGTIYLKNSSSNISSSSNDLNKMFKTLEFHIDMIISPSVNVKIEVSNNERPLEHHEDAANV